jgi:hypothetical protein
MPALSIHFPRRHGMKSLLLIALAIASNPLWAGLAKSPVEVPVLDALGLVGLALAFGLAGVHLIRRFRDRK